MKIMLWILQIIIDKKILFNLNLIYLLFFLNIDQLKSNKDTKKK
jgi:hypothetical protein